MNRHRMPMAAGNRVRILATSDLHMNLTGYNYTADRDEATGGLARVAGLVRHQRALARREGVPVLLFDNGDAIQGGPMDEVALRGAGAHPLMRVFAEMGYDAIGLGNHDFDFGIDALLGIVAAAPCPVISSNLVWLDRPAPDNIRPWAVLQRAGRFGPMRIGVMSFLPPQTTLWNARHLQGRVAVSDILCSARTALAALRAQGCDLVVALAHSGLGAGAYREGTENAALALAALDGIDAVIAGHTHDRAAHGASTDGLCPVVLPGSAGSALGIIDMNGGGAADSDAAVTLLAADARVPRDPAVMQALARDHAATRAFWSRAAGRSDRSLHSYFSFVAPDRGLALVAAAQAAALRPFLKGTPEGGLDLLSVAAPSRYGSRAGPGHYTDIPAGPLRLRHLADLCAFPNMLSAVVMTGWQIRDWLEKSASLFRRVEPGSRDAPLLVPDLPGHDFDVIHGLRYEIGLDSPARFAPGGREPGGAGRIRDLRFGGMPVDPEQRFVVAVNSYRANGGGGFPHLPGAPAIALPEIEVRNALLDYLAGRLPRDPLEALSPPWRFARQPGSSVRFPVGPGARAHLDELGARLLAVDGPDEDGFLQVHLAL